MSPKDRVIKRDGVYQRYAFYCHFRRLGYSVEIPDKASDIHMNLRYQQQDCSLTLREGVEEYRAYLSAICLLYTSPSPRDRTRSRMPSSA